VLGSIVIESSDAVEVETAGALSSTASSVGEGVTAWSADALFVAEEIAARTAGGNGMCRIIR
jgi:hypothetical protein